MTTGLSVTDANSASTAAAACANCSRTAPCTCGMARRLKGSWVRAPALAARIALPARNARNRCPTRACTASDAQRQDFGIERAQSGRADSRTSWRQSDPPSRAAARCARAQAPIRPVGAGRAVDQAQAFLGLEHQRLEVPALASASAPAKPLTSRRAWPAPMSTEAMCAMCVRYPDRALRRHLRQVPPARSASSRSTSLSAHARIPVSEVIDRGGDDGAHSRRLERRPDPDGVAHDDVARQLALLGRGAR